MRLVLISIILCFLNTSCALLARHQVEASIWMNNGFSFDRCGTDKASSSDKEAWDYGFYRRLNDGKFEFMPYCDPRSKDWIAIHRSDLERMINATLPDSSSAQSAK